MKDRKFIAKTFAGLEEILAKEIKQIGAKNITIARRAVIFEGDKKTLYRANYCLRTALRILLELKSFKFRNVDHFYKQCKEIDWLEWLNVKNSFAVYSTVNNSTEFRNSMFASLKVKDAIADYFRSEAGRRPDVDTENPGLIINAHISDNTCTLSIDSSGESLHKRGYRLRQGKAPLNEVLAAGMVLLSGWDGSTDFIDPMCGSGTLPIEAALIAANIPPGVFRKEFAFEKWPGFDSTLFTDITEETEPVKITKNIYVSDISGHNIGIAKANAMNAGIFKHINFLLTDFKRLELKTNGATIMINPPYGERLQVNDLEQLYTMIGERLKHKYPGNTAWILSSSKNLFYKIGLKHTSNIQLYNGALKCNFRKYDLFEGKRKV